MTPLAATLATSMAIGIGISLARSERQRQRGRARRAQDERLGLHPAETLAQGLHRMALAQVELVLELLDARNPTPREQRVPDERAVHETRKAIKRLRALLRVLRGELGERAYERENAALREIARRLSGARDATVMLATLDGLIERHPHKLSDRPGVLALRRRLLAESARTQRVILADPVVRAEVIGELQALRWRIAAWALPAGGGFELIDTDLQRLYRQGSRRLRRAARGHGGRSRALHRWRTRVKDLRYAAEMLERRTPAGGRGNGARAAKKGVRRQHQKRLHAIATRADELGELLGEEHDLAVLAERLRAARSGKKSAHEELWRTGRRTRVTLLELIAKRRRTLRRRALRRGERLFCMKPRRLAGVLRRAYEEVAGESR